MHGIDVNLSSSVIVMLKNLTLSNSAGRKDSDGQSFVASGFPPFFVQQDVCWLYPHHLPATRFSILLFDNIR